MASAVSLLDLLLVLRTNTLDRVARLLGGPFPVVLALLLSIAAAVDAYWYPWLGGLEARSFDLILRHRIAPAKPDPDIVIIDIDEASLAAMAEEYGRWPWPRAVLGEVLDALEEQGARAVFFDVLFADPDIRSPESETLFNEAVERSKHSFYAMLRLDRSRDSKSELHASQVPAAEPDPEGGENGDPTVAMILPRFPAIIASGRVGTVGASPERDNVVRRYALHETAGAWRIPAIPLQVARSLGAPVPEERKILLNWRGPPFAYNYVSFHEVLADALRKQKQRDPKEFAGKIVLIGSTAPALGDLKATPMATLHPGVEILATAIDNLKNDDYYRELGKPLSLAVSLALLWGLAFGVRWLVRGSATGSLMFFIQVVLLTIAYLSLSVTHYSLDLVGPVALGLLFFTIASVRADLRERAAQLGDASLGGLEVGRDYRLLLLIIQPVRASLRRRTRAWLIDRVFASRARARLAHPPFEGHGVLGADFAGLMILYWLVPRDDAPVAETALAERSAIVITVGKFERSRAKFVEQEAEFQWSGDRPGVVGRMMIDALQGLRRSTK
jgi:adenylate cyclase